MLMLYLLKYLKVILIIKNELDGCYDYSDNGKFMKIDVICDCLIY